MNSLIALNLLKALIALIALIALNFRCDIKCNAFFCGAFDCRLLDKFRTVFPYRNKLNRLIMDTEKVHALRHCAMDVLNYGNPINASCDGPEGAHRLHVKGPGMKTNQSAAAAKTMMDHSMHKEASRLLCEAVDARAVDGEASEDLWEDDEGHSVHASRWWTEKAPDDSIAADDVDSGRCLGIRCNIWERAKSRSMLTHCLVGGGKRLQGYAVLDYRLLGQDSYGKLGKYPVLKVLPHKIARFLYEYHFARMRRLDLPELPTDRSEVDVHSILDNSQVLMI